MFERILVPLDGSKAAEASFQYALELASKFGSELLLVHVETPTLALGGQEYLSRLVERAEACGLPATYEILKGIPAECILDRCNRGDVNLLLFCSRGQTGISRFLLGSVADRVARHAECPVMMVHCPPD